MMDNLFCKLSVTLYLILDSIKYWGNGIAINIGTISLAIQLLLLITKNSKNILQNREVANINLANNNKHFINQNVTLYHKP